jgi:hypothetical protein
MELLIVIAVSVLVGFIVGTIEGWRAGEKKRQILIAFLVKRMERLRAASKIKVAQRDTADLCGNSHKADCLTRELDSESVIFYDIQHAISDWCINNNEKDPFAA